MIRHADIFDCADCLCLASRRAALTITRTFERKLRPHGIRVTQFTILTNLILRGAMTVGALAAAIGVERTTLTRNLALIEGEGWVRIKPGKDARSRIVAATPNGVHKVESAHPAWRDAQDAVAGMIGSAGAQSLRRLSSHIAN